jgi:hypothetical protein
MQVGVYTCEVRRKMEMNIIIIIKQSDREVVAGFHFPSLLLTHRDYIPLLSSEG